MASPKDATFLASAVARCVDRPKPEVTPALNNTKGHVLFG
jgi:hypothetical protein